MGNVLNETGENKLLTEYNNKIVTIFMDKISFLSSNFFWITLVIKLCATTGAYFIYSKFAPFVDAKLYLSTCVGYCLNSSWSFRISLTHLFFYSLKLIFISDFAVNLFSSFLTTYILWYVFQRSYNFINKPLFYSAICLPQFLIWSGMVGKEVLLIAGFLLLISSCIDLIIRKRTKILPLLIGLILTLIVRPQATICYGYLLLATIFLNNFKDNYFNKPKNSIIILFISVISTIMILFLCWEYISIPLVKMMKVIKFNYFLSQNEARSNRLDIIFENPIDFVTNLWWGLPISIIGPTLHEVFVRPIMLPAFLEGLFSLALFVCLFIKTINLALINPKYNAFIILGFIPAILIGLILNYPMGIFNPGAAIRYKQSLAPLFYFYPLLLMSEIKMNNIFNR